MASKEFTYNGGVVNSVSNYRKAYYQRKYGSTTPPESDPVAINRMLREYHSEGVTNERKKELKHDILMRAFFLFPHYLKKNYFLSAELFNDAVQSMVCNTLQAIDLFKPELGFPFSNYLIGYFRDAATKTLKSCNIVSTATLRQASIDAMLPPEDCEEGEKPYLIASESETNTDGAQDDPERTVQSSSDDSRSDDTEFDISKKISDIIADEELSSSSDVEYVDIVMSTSAMPVEDDEETVSASLLAEPIYKKQRIIRGAARVLGNSVELDDSREYALAPGMEKELDIDERIHNAQLIEWLEEALSEESGVLNEDERFVLTHHYGLFNHQQMKYEEIAVMRKNKGLGSACSRISQINTAAVRKVRDYFARNGVTE